MEGWEREKGISLSSAQLRFWRFSPSGSETDMWAMCVMSEIDKDDYRQFVLIIPSQLSDSNTGLSQFGHTKSGTSRGKIR
jgi:hypothetical protein